MKKLSYDKSLKARLAVDSNKPDNLSDSISPNSAYPNFHFDFWGLGTRDLIRTWTSDSGLLIKSLKV